MNQILEQLGTYGIVPVVVLQDAAKAEPLAEALCKGGLACAEVTFRTDAAEESIRIMSEKFPEMLVGAGTVLTTEQADRAARLRNAEHSVLPKSGVQLTGKSIVLVDDIVTTGATAAAAIKALREMGAARVYVLTPTKTPHSR